MSYGTILLSALVILGPVAATLGLFFWLRARERNGPKVVVEVQVGEGFYRAVQKPPVFWAMTALTGVSISFSPLFLFMLGRQGVSGFDWRVLGCLLVTYAVPFLYIRLGRPVVEHAWKHRHSPSPDPA